MTTENDTLLIELYERAGVLFRRLAYTETFNEMLAEYNARTKTEQTHRHLWMRLVELNKAGLLKELR